MKEKSKLIVAALGLLLISFGSCEKESSPNSNQSQLETTLWVSEAGIQTSAEKILDQFWSNYAKHKNNREYLSNTLANLNERVSLGDALLISHYALNVGLVKEDSVYEDVKDDSLNLSLQMGDDKKISQKQVCELVDLAIEVVKSSLNQITSQEGKAINRLSISPISTEGATSIVKLKWSISYGKLYSVADMAKGPNVNFNYFSQAIPWISQETFGGTRAQFLSATYASKYFTQVLVGVSESSSPTQSQLEQTWDILPVGKAAHHRLSNRNIFWPDPLMQLSGIYTFYLTGYKPVKTPTFIVVNGVLVQEVNINGYGPNDPLKQIIATDVFDCGNPLSPGLGIDPRSTHMTPSKLLGWYGWEYNYGLTSVRKVPTVALNYFWSKKADLVIEGRRRGQPKMNDMMQALKSGYFALTDFEIKTNQTLDGQCFFNTSCGDLCLHQADYKNWLTFAHYTTQKQTPTALQVYF